MDIWILWNPLDLDICHQFQVPVRVRTEKLYLVATKNCGQLAKLWIDQTLVNSCRLATLLYDRFDPFF